jgi:CRISPR-associated protein Cmr2
VKLDLYAELASLQACPAGGPLPSALASGFVDGCTALAARSCSEDAKNEARRCYRQCAAASELRLPRELDLDADLAKPLHGGWLAIEIAVTLCAPWYSKDDRPFHVLDNPLRKDRIFGVPFMSAAGWKGLLRWAFDMTTGLLGPSPRPHDPAVAKAQTMALHLFGSKKGVERGFHRGALAFYPTWFSRIDFEVINPHDRRERAGTQPILYEVVPPGTRGTLRLLYAPVRGAAAGDGVSKVETLKLLLDATEQLLTVYGFSAKRTAGWGVAKVTKARACAHGGEWREKDSVSELRDKLATLLTAAESET